MSTVVNPIHISVREVQEMVRNTKNKNEPPHDKTNKMTVCPADSNQPGHLPSLIRVFAVYSVGN